MRQSIKRLLALVVMLALLVPAMAVAEPSAVDFGRLVARAEPNNTLATATPLTVPAGPSINVTDTLTATETSEDEDIYKVRLTRGQSITVSLRTGAPNSFVVAGVFTPGSTTDSEPVVVGYYDTVDGSSPARYTATVTGDHYIWVIGFSESTDTFEYAMSVTVRNTTAITLARPPAVVAYSASPLITGRVSPAVTGDTTVGAGYVQLQTSTNGRTYGAARTLPLSATGTFSARVPGVKTKTWVRARFVSTDGVHASSGYASVTLFPRAKLSGVIGTSFVTLGRGATYWGQLWPRHAPGSPAVKLTCKRYERVNGRMVWVTRKTVMATASNYLDHSKYSALVKLPSRGSWRIYASHHDTTHALTTATGYKSVTVR